MPSAFTDDAASAGVGVASCGCSIVLGSSGTAALGGGMPGVPVATRAPAGAVAPGAAVCPAAPCDELVLTLPEAANASAADANGAANAVCSASQQAMPRINRCEPGR